MTAEARLDDPLAEALDVVGAHDDYRVLRRIKALSDIPIFPAGDEPLRYALLIDTEGTGLEPKTDRIIEIAVTRIGFNTAGRICSVEEPRIWLEDPGRSLDPLIVSLTGLTDADLTGQSFPDDEIIAHFDQVEVCIAHNAAYDAKMIEARFPSLAGRPWACSCADLNWRELGFEGRALSHLLLQMGWFYQGHRAEIDIIALAMLLSHQIDGITSLCRLLDEARKPTNIVRAVRSPYETKDILKARGYSWHPDDKVWWIKRPPEETPAEREWLAAHVYRNYGAPTVEQIDWTRRHR